MWINFPLLSHIIPDAVGELVNYTLLEEYVIELKLLEHEAEIKRALFKKKNLHKRREAIIALRTKHIEVGELKTQIGVELRSFNLQEQQHRLIKEHSGWIKYGVSFSPHLIDSINNTRIAHYQQRLGLSSRQMAALLVLCSYSPDLLPSQQFDKWTGVNHLFKSRRQLEQEIESLGSAGPMKMKVTSLSTMIDQGLKRYRVASFV